MPSPPSPQFVVLCQLGLVAALLAGLMALGLPWGAWVPMLGVFLGATVYVWLLVPPGGMADRARLKGLALRAGGAWGAFTAVAVAGVYVVHPGHGGMGGSQAVGLALLGGAGVAAICALLTLVGLDLGRTGTAAGEVPEAPAGADLWARFGR